MYKVVINDCYGGFNLSHEAISWLKNKGLTEGEIKSLQRHDPLLIQCIEELGDKASGKFSKLIIEEITERIYRIVSYDGLEELKFPHEEDWVIIEEEKP